MKIRKAATMLASAGLCLAGISTAQAGDTATPYLQIGAGANFMEPLVFQGTGSFAPSAHGDLGFTAGPIVTGAVGYAFGNNMRAEFELGWRDAPGKSLTLHTTGGGTAVFNGGGMNVYTFLVNGLYDYDLNHVSPSLDHWSVHAGFGIGMASVTSSTSPSAAAFAYQPIAGLEYAYNTRLRFGIDYRYLGTTGLNLNYTQAGSAAGRTVDSNLADHAVLLTLRWNIFEP